jgi:hypothetical protein
MNLIYFPCWTGVVLVVSSLKFQLLTQLYKVVLVTVLSAFILIEVARLYLGYLGIHIHNIYTYYGFDTL